ncbi:ATP-binding protein [Actinokineospora guangxiensis]|uniref:histidine kinase n=1 Tax=Actinokineospora guangxiensis TaxID=1490288 RepID=A0ABW0EZ51_9PSEU
MRRLPLHLRVMVWFGLVSLAVCSALAVLTWNMATGYMLDQRERAALNQATANSRLVAGALDEGGLRELVTGLGAELESAVMVIDGGRVITGGNLIDPTRLPREFTDLVTSGTPVRQRTMLDGAVVLAVGLTMPQSTAAYVEVFPLRELDRTFRYLGWMLTVGAACGGLAGAVLGRWAARHALAPLGRMIEAAGRAARGDLSVRLPDAGDADLIPLARAFNDTAEGLERRVARDARFAGDVSHELRSPLTTMLNAMAVLRRRRGELPPGALPAVDLLDNELHRFRRLVGDLLEISRTDPEADALDPELIDLAQLVREAISVLPTSRAVLDVTGSPRVHADRRSLERIVTNLVDNANQHGGGLVRVGVSGDGRTARVEVDDDGPGVPADQRDTVFERFARGAPADRGHSGGVGLGLALVSQHVHRHGGTVTVTDRPGGGARFTVEFPEATP